MLKRLKNALKEQNKAKKPVGQDLKFIMMGYNINNSRFRDALMELGIEHSDLDLVNYREFSESVKDSMGQRPLAVSVSE